MTGMVSWPENEMLYISNTPDYSNVIVKKCVTNLNKYICVIIWFLKNTITNYYINILMNKIEK